MNDWQSERFTAQPQSHRDRHSFMRELNPSHYSEGNIIGKLQKLVKMGRLSIDWRASCVKTGTRQFLHVARVGTDSVVSSGFSTAAFQFH